MSEFGATSDVRFTSGSVISQGGTSIAYDRAGRGPVVILVGGASLDWWHDTARAVVDALPDGSYAIVEGQTHDVDPEVLAQVLSEFLLA